MQMREEEQLNDKSDVASKQQPTRIGVSLGRVPSLNVSALRFLILQMNSLQRTFEFEFLLSGPHFNFPFLPGEYEFLPTDRQDDFCIMLSSKSPINKDRVRDEAPIFLQNYREFLQGKIRYYNIKQALPDHIVLLTFAHFSDNYYTMRLKGLSILAMGNWERDLAPPSILEFILTIILREAVAFVSPLLRGSIHIGTKGCLLDFSTRSGSKSYKALFVATAVICLIKMGCQA
jgi:hypothetical protein